MRRLWQAWAQTWPGPYDVFRYAYGDLRELPFVFDEGRDLGIEMQSNPPQYTVVVPSAHGPEVWALLLHAHAQTGLGGGLDRPRVLCQDCI